jgi:hypothetical protein
MVQQIGKLVQFLLGDFDGAASTARLRKLLPVVREYTPQLREFGTVLIARLTEKSISRGLSWASLRLRDVDSGRRFPTQAKDSPSTSAIPAASR